MAIGGKGQARAVITGILADPDATSRLKAELAAKLQKEAKRVGDAVRAKTPVSRHAGYGTTNPPPGTLRAKVESRAFQTRKGIGISVSADKALRKGTKGDPPKRYGKVPYGVFVDNATGFLVDTVSDEFGRMLEAIDGAIQEYVAGLNAGSGRVPSE